MRSLLLFTSALVLLLGLNVLTAAASPTFAPLDGCGAGNYTWNYATSQYDSYSPDGSATYIAGTGWRRTGSGTATIYQPIDFSSLTNWSLTISVSGNISLNAGVGTYTRIIDNTLTDVHVLYGPTPYGGAPATNTNLIAYFQHASGTTSTLEIFTASGTRVCGAPAGINKPLADEDIDTEFGIFDIATFPGDEDNPLAAIYNPDENLVIAMSDTVGDLVYAVDDGTVLSIQPIQGSDCFGLANILGYCMLRFDPDAVAGTSYVASDYFFTVNRTNLWRVLVSTAEEGVVVQYIVADADQYVEIGTEVTAGCIIGKTTQLSPSGPLPLEKVAASLGGALGFQLDSPNSEKGVTFIGLSDGNTGLLPLFDQLVLPVDPGQACNLDPATASCLFGDPNLEDRDQWVAYGGVQWLSGGGAVLQPGAQLMYDGLPLVSSTAYSLTVVAQRQGAAGAYHRIQLGLGTTLSSQLDMPVVQDSYTIAAATHTADRGSLYSARVINAGTSAFQVISLCISDGTADLVPDTCYFNNSSFEQNLTDWTSTGSTGAGNTAGEIYMQDDATISQNAHLYPNGASPHTYTVTIRAAIGGGQQANANKIKFSGRFPSSGGSDNVNFAGPNSDITGYPAQAFYSWQGNEVVYTASVVVSSATNGGFLIRLDIEGGGGLYVYVREVCINDPFAHHPTGGGTRIWLPSNCGGRISPPTDLTDLGSWTFWLWQNMDAFNQCDLMPMLQRLFNVTYDIHSLFRWTVLYGQSVGGIYVGWLGDSFLPWLQGNFNNIVNGRVTTVGASACNNIFCALDAFFGLAGSVVDIIRGIVDTLLGLITQAVTLLLDTVSALVSLIFSILNQLFSFFGRLFSFGNAVVAGWNNSNQPISFQTSASVGTYDLVDQGGGGGAVQTQSASFFTQFRAFSDTTFNCGLNPRQKPVCITLWVAENTAFSRERAGLIWLMSGVALLGYVLWVINQFRVTIRKASAAL